MLKIMILKENCLRRKINYYYYITFFVWRQASRMVNTMWDMSVVNEWGVIFLQAKADYSLDCLIR